MATLFPAYRYDAPSTRCAKRFFTFVNPENARETHPQTPRPDIAQARGLCFMPLLGKIMIHTPSGVKFPEISPREA